jgi:hypothetical protein
MNSKSPREIEVNFNVESPDGTWEILIYTPKKRKIINFSYWKKDDATPSISIDLTKREYEDLQALIKKIDK